MVAKAKRKADPHKTKTGKTLLGPLNLVQLNKLLEDAQKPKEKARIRSRIAILENRK